MVIAEGKSIWEFSWPKKHLTEKNCSWHASEILNSGRDWLDVKLEHCFVCLRDLDNRKIGVKVFRELRNVVLEENGEDKMVRAIRKFFKI